MKFFFNFKHSKYELNYFIGRFNGLQIPRIGAIHFTSFLFVPFRVRSYPYLSREERLSRDKEFGNSGAQHHTHYTQVIPILRLFKNSQKQYYKSSNGLFIFCLATSVMCVYISVVFISLCPSNSLIILISIPFSNK